MNIVHVGSGVDFAQKVMTIFKIINLLLSEETAKALKFEHKCIPLASGLHVHKVHTSVIQKNKFQTKHCNLDATNAYPQLDTSTRHRKLCTINPTANITC